MNFKLWLENQPSSAMLDKIHQYLAGIEKAGFRLIAHQTSDDQALKIIKKEDFSDRGVDGTALFANSDNIRATLEKMNACDIPQGKPCGFCSVVLKTVRKHSFSWLIDKH